MSSAIDQAIRQIVEEKGLAYESVIDAIQAALAAAYRKDFGDKNQNIEAKFRVEDGSTQVWDVKTVVEDMDLEELEKLEEERKQKAEAFAMKIEEARRKGEHISAVSMDDEMGPRFNPKTDIMLSQAKILKHGAKIGDVIYNELAPPSDFGRMAAMTAKQVITQKLREAEREVVFNEYKEHEGELMNATVQRREGRIVLVDLGRSTGVMRAEDQIATERYNTGDRVKVFVRQVALTTKGPEILVSRTADAMVHRLFEIEVPEVGDGIVEIKSIAREAGSRSKVAVACSDTSIDPIGACIGQRGSRIQMIISELGGEKVDIVEWSEDPKKFITNALSPAHILEVDANEDEKTAMVKVNADQLSLAIGKGGQNVRLAARLTGWKINISEVEKKAEEVAEDSAVILSESEGSLESKDPSSTAPPQDDTATSESSQDDTATSESSQDDTLNA